MKNEINEMLDLFYANKHLYHKIGGDKMIIETNPCESCDFSPAVCSCEIEICQMSLGNTMLDEKRYMEEKLSRYLLNERNQSFEFSIEK